MVPPNQTTKKWIDKKQATTFQVRYRSQNDPLIHDDSATDFVFAEVEAPNAHKSGAATNSKTKTARELEAELQSDLGIDVSKIRKNEGEASMYGIYYDDTTYDYMQHMREMGGSEAVYIDAVPAGSKQRKDRHKKQSLDQALAEQKPKSTVVHLPKELLPSEVEVKRTYQDMQDVPDVIAGFQPDMDPRLREVLEALEDEAYVDDDEDIFAELTQDGEATIDEFFDAAFDDEDDGWDSDVTEKAAPQTTPAPTTTATTTATPAAPAAPAAAAAPATEEEGGDEWMREYSKFKKAQKKEKKLGLRDDDMSSLADTMSFGGSSVMTGGTMSGAGRRRRKREKKGTTSTTSYSMSSSALFRTEGLTLLDDRFDRIEEEYNQDSEEEEMTGPVPETRKDFDSIMDEFLNGYSMTGQRAKTHRVRRGKYQSGLDQLDEVRRELGKARISTK